MKNEEFIEVEAEEKDYSEEEDTTATEKDGFFKSIGKKIWRHKKGIAIGLAFTGGVLAKTFCDRIKFAKNGVEDDLELPEYEPQLTTGNDSSEENTEEDNEE